jgi:uncharacterized SAM-dependent methyltransferase
MRKTKYLLESIVKQGLKGVTYYALDLSEKTLIDCLNSLAVHFPSIKFVGLLGTYEDSLEYIKNNIPSTDPLTGSHISRTIMWLGSSIGNFDRDGATQFLKRVNDSIMQSGDTFLCGIDRRNSPEVVKLAYDDLNGGI